MKNSFGPIEASKKVRQTVWEMIFRARASHVGSAFSCIDLISTIYFSGLFQICPEIPISNRDSFVLSKGHACTALYAILYHKGYLSKLDIESYGLDGSNLMHHASHKVNGVDLSTGSLGHGLNFSAGLALNDRIDNKSNTRICLVGDGELMEGSNWEAILFAAHMDLDNLLLIIDYNNLQSLTTVSETIAIEPLQDKFKAFGWGCQVINGHDCEAIRISMQRLSSNRPNVIIANTIKGKGISFMENSVEWHYRNPTYDEFEIGMEEIQRA